MKKVIYLLLTLTLLILPVAAAETAESVRSMIENLPTVEAFKAAGLTDVKIIIGGAPVSEEFRAQIGADVYTPDAASAADAAVKICAGC